MTCYQSVVEKKEVGPTGILCVEMLLAAILEAETLVEFVGWCIGGKCIQTDGHCADYLSIFLINLNSAAL